MKISEITLENVKHYLRITEADFEDDVLLTSILKSAKKYISSMTGLTDAELDEYVDLSVATLIICQDMYDNRAYVQENSGRLSSDANRVAENILGMHARNLL